MRHEFRLVNGIVGIPVLERKVIILIVIFSVNVIVARAIRGVMPG